MFVKVSIRPWQCVCDKYRRAPLDSAMSVWIHACSLIYKSGCGCVCKYSTNSILLLLSLGECWRETCCLLRGSGNCFPEMQQGPGSPRGPKAPPRALDDRVLEMTENKMKKKKLKDLTWGSRQETVKTTIPNIWLHAITMISFQQVVQAKPARKTNTTAQEIPSC